MLKNLYNRFFPIPQFLVASSFGLDISDESIKYAELLRGKNGIKLGHYGELKIPSGIIEAGKIKDAKGVESLLISLRKEKGMKSARVSLPEEQVFLFNLKLSKAGLVSVRESIELALEDYVPISAEEAVFDYDVLHEDEQSLKLQVAAIAKDTMDSYLSIFKNAGVNILSFELEAHPIARCLIKKGDMGTYMIVDFGKKRTGIFIVSGGVVVFTSTLNLGGDTLTEAIAKGSNINLEEAEKRKDEYGLKSEPGNESVANSVLDSLSVLVRELKKQILYWQTHKDEESRERPSLQKIILCGRSSNLIGLADFLSVDMKIESSIADVWVNIGSTAKETPDLSMSESLGFATALGLALGNFEYD